MKKQLIFEVSHILVLVKAYINRTDDDDELM